MPEGICLQPMSRMSGDAGEDIRKPRLRIDAVHFCRDDEAVHGCGAPPSAIRAAEQPGLPSKSDASQASFGGIVGETHASIVQEQREAPPSLQDVIERLGQVVTTRQFGELFAHVDLKVLDQRPAQRLSHLKTLFGAPSIDGALDLEQRIDPPHDLDRDRRERDFLFSGALAPCILFNVGHGEERAPSMRPAGSFTDRSGLAPGQIELVVPFIGVGL